MLPVSPKGKTAEKDDDEQDSMVFCRPRLTQSEERSSLLASLARERR
jgi:hypothetical protein